MLTLADYENFKANPTEEEYQRLMTLASTKEERLLLATVSENFYPEVGSPVRTSTVVYRGAYLEAKNAGLDVSMADFTYQIPIPSIHSDKSVQCNFCFQRFAGVPAYNTHFLMNHADLVQTVSQTVTMDLSEQTSSQITGRVQPNVTVSTASNTVNSNTALKYLILVTVVALVVIFIVGRK